MVLFRPRQRRFITLVALGCWLFAFFAGAVNACAVVGELVDAHNITNSTTHHHDDSAAPSDCEQFCANDLLIPAKVKLFEHQPAEQAFLLVPAAGVPIMSGATPDSLLLDHPDPPPGIALYARFLRLTL